jgi:hypothetical protein
VQRERRALDSARKVTGRLEAAEAKRKAFLDSMSAWVNLLVTIDAWGKQTHELNHEFVHAYRVEPPPATCSESHCVKQLAQKFAVPESGKLGEREAVFDIILTLVDGGVARAELMGPDLFSRVGEASQRTVVSNEDAQARAEAIAVSKRLVAAVLDSRLPEAECKREVVSPVVLWRECRGVSVRVIAALEAGGEDRISVEPIDESLPNREGGDAASLQ